MSHMKILLAEDDMLIAMDMQAILEDAGHTVLGPVATATQGQALAEDDRPDLAIVDIGLKDGESGLDLARALRTSWQVPVIFVSGEPSRAQAGRDAAVAFLPKPVMPHDLERAIAVTQAIAAGEPVPDAPRQLQIFQTEPLPTRH